MYYYYFADMESLRMSMREALENIFIILYDDGRWDCDEAEETKKMLAMFENPDKILSEVMSIKEIDTSSKKRLSLLNLSTQEKSSAMIENPEEWVAEIQEDVGEGLLSGFYDDSEEKKERFEKIKALARFVLKMAVYRFCRVHFPKILKKSGQDIELHVEQLENEMEEWEKQFWTVWVGHSVEVSFQKWESIFDMRSSLRYQYTRRKLEQGSREERDIWQDCIVRAFKDIDTVEEVKKLRRKYCEELTSTHIKSSSSNSKNYIGKKEIESIKKLTEIMEKQLKDELDNEDVNELKKHVSEWNEDIRKLTGILNQLPEIGQ